jgi:RTA1 like protein
VLYHTFATYDLISFILHAVGGATASIALHQGKNSKPGTSIRVASIVSQVFTAAIFIAFFMSTALSDATSRRRLSFLVFVGNLVWAALALPSFVSRRGLSIGQLSLAQDGRII